MIFKTYFSISSILFSVFRLHREHKTYAQASAEDNSNLFASEFLFSILHAIVKPLNLQ